jgi:heme/copper-type cytochrome/quinol oxidase subunit 3
VQHETSVAHGAEAPLVAPMAAHHYTTTGLDHRKILMWVFLGSETMFFGALISVFLINAPQTAPGLGPIDVFDIPYTSVSAFVLLMSSLTMVLALGARQRLDIQRMRIWLLATSLLGAVFVGGQYFEFSEFFHKGLSLEGSLFGASFFVLTGFHGAHVTIGIIWLMSLFVGSLMGGRAGDPNINISSLQVEICGLYWHFVDIVWIIIFTVVYLMRAA